MTMYIVKHLLLFVGRAKRAPHWGVQSRLCVIYVCRFVCLGMPKCVGGITWPKNVHAQFWAVKNDLRHPCYSFLLYGYARAALAWTK